MLVLGELAQSPTRLREGGLDDEPLPAAAAQPADTKKAKEEEPAVPFHMLFRCSCVAADHRLLWVATSCSLSSASAF